MGLAFYKDGSATFRVWAPHANSASLLLSRHLAAPAGATPRPDPEAVSGRGTRPGPPGPPTPNSAPGARPAQQRRATCPGATGGTLPAHLAASISASAAPA
jgi:hypothetical protein